MDEAQHAPDRRRDRDHAARGKPIRHRRRATPTPTTRTSTRTTLTPTRTTLTPTPIPTTRRSTGALARCIEPTGDSEFLDEVFEQEPLYVPRAEPGRYDDLLSLEDLERMLCSGGLRHPAFRLVKAGERLDLARLRDRHPVAARAVHGHDRRPERTHGVRERRHGRPPGAPPHASTAGRVLPVARGRARAAGSGERVLHAARLAGTARPPRHARRVLPAGRGPEALARLRAGARAAAPQPALSPGAGRARGAGARPRARAGRHAVHAPRVAARGTDVRRGLAPPHDRRQRLHLARRAAGRARRLRGRARAQALGAG